MKEKVAVSKRLSENIAQMEEFFHECDDIKKKELMLGRQMDVACYLTFIEVSVDMGTSALSEVLKYLKGLGKEEIYQALEQNALGISDATYFDTIEDAVDGLLTGEVILFVDGFDRAVKIPDDGYPNMGITEADSEKVIRGSNEGFCDSVKQNAALIRKRIRSPKVKVKQKKCGMRSNTNVYLVFMEDLVYPGLVREIGHRLEGFEIDGVLDSGVIEQLTEEKWYSPFPQFQTTERPDRAAMAVLEGRVVVLSDNSPVGLILPTMLLLSFADARSGVPFPAVVEVILMELSFELLREAGVRLPGAMGNTIGIVGGLIIGQAAVEANLVSPIVVIVISFTALCSFAIPNEEFATAFRLLKFFFIGMCAWLGYFGMLLGLLFVLIHLAHLKSFGIPYLMPFVGADLTDYEDERDFLWRWPIRKLTKRPIYARREERVKLKLK